MKINPKKAKIVLKVPCSLCEGRQMISRAKEHPTGNTSAWSEPCSWCKQTGEETVEMTLEEFFSHLLIKIPEPPVSIGSAAYRPETIVWRQP